MKKFIRVILATAITTIMATSTLTFNSFAITDPNGDGRVDIADVVYITSYLKGQFDVSDLSALDFNGDYMVSQIDSLAIQRYLVGMSY